MTEGKKISTTFTFHLSPHLSFFFPTAFQNGVVKKFPPHIFVSFFFFFHHFLPWIFKFFILFLSVMNGWFSYMCTHFHARTHARISNPIKKKREWEKKKGFKGYKPACGGIYKCYISFWTWFAPPPFEKKKKRRWRRMNIRKKNFFFFCWCSWY